MKDMFPSIAVERNGPVSYQAEMGKKHEDNTTQEQGLTKVKPKVVVFFKNGDRHFNGVQVSITPRRFRNFENLLNELTRITNLPHGVRYVFTPYDGKRIEDLHQLENGKSYVCASFRKFKKLEYGRTSNVFGSQTKISSERGRFTLSERPSESDSLRGSRVTAMKPRIITVIRNGYTKPRKAVKVLLNRKTAQTYEQVLDDITSAVGVEGSSGIRKLYTSEGVLVHDLSHLLNNGQIFVAVGNEKFNPSEIKELLEQVNQRHNQPNKPLSNIPVRVKGKYEASDMKEEAKNEITKQHIVNNENQNPNKSDRSLISLRAKKPWEKISPAKGLHEPVEKRKLSSSVSPSNVVLQPKAQNSILPKIKQNISQQEPNEPTSTRKSFDILPNISQKPSLTNEDNETTNRGQPQKPQRTDGSVKDYYNIGKKLGDGNFAVVREITDKETLKPYALKIIDCAKIKGKESMIKNEIDIMKACRHPNIVDLIEDYHTPTEIYLVLELVKGGDLFDLISSSVKFAEKEAVEYIVDICKALNYLHKRNIVHRDLKPENLLVDEHPDGSKSLKLADFGLAMEVTEPIYTVCGTPTYVAPEILNESGYGLEVDIWAAGVIGYIMLCGFPPFRSAKRRQSELFDLIEAGEFEFLSPYWDEVSPKAKDLISCLLVVDRKVRYTAEKVLEHPWITENSSKRSLSDLISLPDIQASPALRRFKVAALTVQSTHRLQMLSSTFQMSRGERVLTHVDPKS